MAKGDPNIAGVNFHIVPIEAALEATPTATEVALLIVPDNAGYQVELKSITYTAHTLPIDAGGVLVDIEWVDDSAADAVTDLKAGFDLTVGGSVARVGTEVWRGSQILDPGDTVNAEFTTDGTLTTAAVGPALQVEYRIIEKSGS
jgi:hypothetical protein